MSIDKFFNTLQGYNKSDLRYLAEHGYMDPAYDTDDYLLAIYKPFMYEGKEFRIDELMWNPIKHEH